MPRDGDAKRIEAHLLFIWQEDDSSVGINEGWIFMGVEIVSTGDNWPNKLLEVDYTSIPGRAAYVFDDAARREIESYQEPDDEEDPDLGRDDPND